MTNETETKYDAFYNYLNVYFQHKVQEINQVEAVSLIEYSLSCFVRDHFVGLEADYAAIDSAELLLNLRRKTLESELSTKEA